MEFFTIQISVADGQLATAITPKETKDEAIMVLHQILASAMANDKVTECTAIVTDLSGAIYKNENYVRQIATEQTE